VPGDERRGRSPGVVEQSREALVQFGGAGPAQPGEGSVPNQRVPKGVALAAEDSGDSRRCRSVGPAGRHEARALEDRQMQRHGGRDLRYERSERLGPELTAGDRGGLEHRSIIRGEPVDSSRQQGADAGRQGALSTAGAELLDE
jgi:hypothetical protein